MKNKDTVLPTRIDPEGTALDAIVTMSEGNIGAAGAIMALRDRESDVRIFVLLLTLLDIRSIYGEDIYVLYNDKCDRDVERFAQMIEYAPSARLVALSKDHRGEINVTEDEIKQWAASAAQQAGEGA